MLLFKVPLDVTFQKSWKPAHPRAWTQMGDADLPLHCAGDPHAMRQIDLLT